MNRQLSQQEIDAVFQNLQVQTGSKGGSSRAVPFDFKRADRIAKSQLRTIHFLHETFVRNLISNLSAYLRSYLSGNLVTVEQLPYAEFLEALPSPTCMVSLSLRPYHGNAVLELNPPLVFSILELLLGGKAKSPAAIQREVTEIEQNLLDRLFRIIVHELAETWKAIATIEFQIESLETEPQFLQIITPSEAVVAIGIELHIGETVGTMNLAIPSITIKMMRQKFDQQWTARKLEQGGATQARILRLLRQARLHFDARLQGAVGVQQLTELKPGDVVSFDSAAGGQLEGTVNGRPKFKGRIVANNHKLGFQIEEHIEAGSKPGLPPEG
ncbi:MAG TPA: flagellar motor switch protein FliM [Bryobacteraceae bacterium]|nr:flagellar motor switch protein FliM [Bryobacteraceae bacterium]